MYAVIKTGGKQYRVSAGQKLKVEQIPADVGAEVTLDQILMVGEGESVKIGAPFPDRRRDQLTSAEAAPDSSQAHSASRSSNSRLPISLALP